MSFGTEISDNKMPESELSLEMCYSILYSLEKGKPPSQLGKEFHIDHSTIYYTLLFSPQIS